MRRAHQSLLRSWKLAPQKILLSYPKRCVASKNNSEVKTLSDLQELMHRTERLTKVLEEDATKRSWITSQYCYQLLERWMNTARETKNPAHGNRAKDLISKLEKHGQGILLEPKRLFYDLVLQALAFCDASKAQHFLLSEMPKNDMNTKSFNIAINAWAKHGGFEAGIQAEKLFRNLENLHQAEVNEKHDLQPNQRTITGVVEAWANSGHPSSPERILAILQFAIHKVHRSDLKSISLDTVFFNTVIRALANIRGDREAANTCERVLQLMQDFDGLEPSTRTYSMVLHAWAQCEKKEKQGRAAKRAEKILGTMTELYTNGADVKPTTKSFTTCIAAYSRCDAPERAQMLLEKLLDLYKKTKDPDLRPDAPAGNAVVIAWSRSQRPDFVVKTKQALAKLEEFAEPDLISYNSLIHAFSRDGDASAALELVEWLENVSAFEPDVVSYNSVINALAKSQSREAALQAERLLSKMEDLASCGRLNVLPTSVTYTSVVNAWANSKDPSPAEPSYRIYKIAKNSQHTYKGSKPDIVFFVSLIQTFAKEQENRPAALAMAKEVFEEITTCKRIAPNEATFTAMINACNKLAPDREEWLNLVTSITKQCQSCGYLSRRVLTALRGGTSADSLQQILGCTSTSQLPEKWSRGVPRQHRP